MSRAARAARSCASTLPTGRPTHGGPLYNSTAASPSGPLRNLWRPGRGAAAAAAAAEAAAAAAAAATAAVVATPPPQPAESRRGLVLSWPLQQAHDGHLNRTYAAALRKALLRVQGRAALVLSVSCGIGLQPIVAAQARPEARTRSLTRTAPP